MFTALKKYAVFSGRARRKEYWLFMLLCFILNIAGSFIDVALGTFNAQTGLGVVGLILLFAILLPSIAVSIRRLHDTDRSGWWFLIGFIPILGMIVLLIFACLDGTVGPNRFGEDPKAEERVLV
ncbi:MAG: DUF805 domain-containing protein [Proteobacteria bacterium]|nr:DUF805 domain-containing protein [Pseudomonadota bacterium]